MWEGEVAMAHSLTAEPIGLGMGVEPPPADLLPAAVKLARRLQALPPGTFYAIMLVKETAHEWKLVVLNEKGNKVEVLR